MSSHVTFTCTPYPLFPGIISDLNQNIYPKKNLGLQQEVNLLQKTKKVKAVQLSKD